MAKIYNEVIIDMNPESSTFEEVLHEDSYEYEGDMMLAQRGVYQGAATMEAEKSRSLWDLLEGQKRHRKKTKKQLGKRGMFGRISDIVETGVGFIPGIGKIAKPILNILSKQAEQKMFKLPEYKDKGGFWTSKKAEKYKEKDVAIREGADTTFLEGIMGEVEGWVGSIPGGDFISSLFTGGGGGDQLSPSFGWDTYTGNISPEFMSQFQTSEESSYELKEGGRVPKKYYGGGNVQSGSPTIANYFSAQGKTLGGSDTQSLAGKLGRI